MFLNRLFKNNISIQNGLMKSFQYSNSRYITNGYLYSNNHKHRNFSTSTTPEQTTTTTEQRKKELNIPYQFLTLTKEQWDSSLGKNTVISKSLADQFTLVNKDRTTLLRKPTFECIDWLQSQKERSFVKESPLDYFRILDGSKGTGKSVALSQVVFWATQQNWLVLYISSANHFINNGSLTKFEQQPLLFQQNDMAYPFLNDFLSLNQDKLKEISLKTKFKIKGIKFESSPEFTLYDLLSKNHFDSSSEIFYHFKRELNAVTEFPVLVAIDGYNYFLRASDYGDMFDPSSQFRTLPVDRLLIPSQFKDIKNHSLTNGVVVACTSDEVQKEMIPYEIPEKGHFISVERFSLYECRLFISYLLESGFLTKSPPQESIQYLWQMASGNPRELWKLLRIYN
ncbi:hypothetical protein DLAC_06347 [Tieghemostelium lacteum]|uniref:Small ribosomal subunit protein mS29 n=1 Tax=Tieghemostelium lacteum TaxID=361077 RepID=A0A151ZEN3_TIELA|nr:hypothetical protein DLAC_06347 [Tieghemostelium lacteum]|eukprot:KYQ92379.1 hypothetical protein DLAC_06347 [Tieghemostelium lacteum]